MTVYCAISTHIHMFQIPTQITHNLCFHSQNATLTFCQDDKLVKNHILVQCIHTIVQSSVNSVVGDKPQGPLSGFEAPDVNGRPNAIPFNTDGFPSVVVSARRQTREIVGRTILYDEGMLFTCELGKTGSIRTFNCLHTPPSVSNLATILHHLCAEGSIQSYDSHLGSG